MRILVILLLLTSYVHAQSDCIVKLPVEGGDSVVFNLNTVLYAVQTNNRTGVALNDNNVRSGYIRTGVIIDTVVARCNNELILFTDAQNGLKTAINRQQILEVKKSISNKAVIVAKWNPRLSFTSTESYASIRALVDACDGGGSTTPASLTWSNTTSALMIQPIGLAYGNGRFVAFDISGDVLTTKDGQRWAVASSLQTTSTYVDVAAFGNGVFVLAHSDDSVSVSTDLETWTKVRVANEVYRVTFTGGLFFAGVNVSGSPKMAYSKNGIDWAMSPTTSLSFAAVASKPIYGGGLWVLPASGNVYTSTNGINWTSSTSSALSPNFGYVGATYGNGRWVYVDDSKSFVSTNGTTWTSHNTPTSFALERGLVYADGKFLLTVGNNIYTSVDGVSWSLVHTAGYQLSYIAYGDGLYVSVPSAGGTSYMYSGQAESGYIDARSVQASNRVGVVTATTDGSGDVTLSFAIPMPDATYSAIAIPEGTTALEVTTHTKTTSSVKFRVFNAGGTALTSQSVTLNYNITDY